MANSVAPAYNCADHPAASIRLLRPARADANAATPGSRIASLVADFPFMHRQRKLGEYLFRAGGDFHCLYVLNAGFVKTCFVSEDGREQTIGIHLRGDILGLEAFATGTYSCDAVAVDTCDVLAIAFETLIGSSPQNPALVREVYKAFSTEIHAERNLLRNMRSLNAAGRVAAFLLEMSARFASRGFSATQLQLRLTRQEIGSMLGLELETVSRTLSQFAQLDLISVCRRKIVLLDRDAIADIITQPAGQKRGREKGSSNNSLCIPRGYSRAALA
jgi:CRP/FNR family transcriptional regulator, anaerobic regulatory protein